MRTRPNSGIGRSILNAEYLIRKISDGNFEEQVRFLNNIDILTSPHGAQLTGIPFLANKPCAQLIRTFPDGSLIPGFFGSLARSLGIAYSYIYANSPKITTTTTTTTTATLNNDDDDAITKEEHQQAATSSLHGRITARAHNICLSPTAVVDIVKDVILDWRKCCGRES
jgi:hypothetical protein